jgi:glucose-1-phosphate adenylyltransferase
MRLGRRWFEGSADAVHQNLNLLGDEDPDYVVVLGADHIYRMDPRQFVDAHIQSGAGVTVAAMRVPRSASSRFGVLLAGPNHKIVKFQEKPAHTEGLSDDPDHVLASMGNYVFRRQALEEAVRADALNVDSSHDMGGNIITMLVDSGDAAVYDFADNVVPGTTERDRGHWADVGTLDQYHQAHMDLVSVHPVFNLYNRQWPIHSRTMSMPPAKFVLDDPDHPGMAVDSVVSEGVVVHGGTIRRSVLSPGVKVDCQALVEDSVLMHDVEIGRGAVVKRAIIDKNVRIPPGTRVGVDPQEDRARGLVVSPEGVVAIGKGDLVAGLPGGGRAGGLVA